MVSPCCRTWPLSARETWRDGPREARRRRSRPPWQRTGDEGMLGYLRRRGARKKPKRLRVLRFRAAGPRRHLGVSFRKGRRAAGANRFGTCLAWRVAHVSFGQGNLRGRTQRKRLGIGRTREGRAVVRRARTAASWMCPYALVSFAEIDRRLAQRRRILRTRRNERTGGGRGERGLGLRMYESGGSVASSKGARLRPRPHAAKLRVA